MGNGFVVPPDATEPTPQQLAMLGYAGMPQMPSAGQSGAQALQGSFGPILARLQQPQQGMVSNDGGSQPDQPQQPDQRQMRQQYQQALQMLPTQLQALQDQTAAMQQLQVASQPRDYLTPDIRAQLTNAMSNIARKSIQGETKAEKGARIGSWVAANVLAPAMAAFGKGGTAIGAAQMMQQLQAQQQQKRSEEKQALREHMDALKSYAGILQGANKSDIADYGAQIKLAQAQIQAQKNLVSLLGRLGVQGGNLEASEARAGSSDALTEERQAKTQSENTFRKPRLEILEARRDKGQEAIKTQQETTKLRTAQTGAANASTEQRQATTSRIKQLTTPQVQAAQARAKTAEEATNTQKERTKGQQLRNENTEYSTASKKGADIKKGVTPNFTPNSQIGKHAAPSREEALRALKQHLAAVKGDTNHPTFKRQLDAFIQMYGAPQ